MPRIKQQLKAPVIKNGVKRDKTVYKINFKSGNKSTGTNSNANFFLGLPFEIVDGYCFIDTLTITAVNNLLFPITLNEIHVKSSSIYSTKSWICNTDGGKFSDSIGEFPCNNYIIRDSSSAGTTISPLYFRYKAMNVSEETSYPISNFDLDSQFFNIKLTDENGTELNSANISSWSLNIVFVEMNNL